MALKHKLAGEHYTEEDIKQIAGQGLNPLYGPDEEDIKRVTESMEHDDHIIMEHLIKAYPERAEEIINSTE